MDGTADEANVAAFEEHLKKSLVIDSLRIALDELLSGCFIRKDVADSILQEACLQYRTLLMSNTLFLPSHYMVGHLEHYRHSSEAWTLTVKDPVIALCVNDAILGMIFVSPLKDR
ncbi:hypothetical protein BdWA1_001627 [Babesia duncani]|uniref:Uncharacterized protein n=1 Tax=Babesia duncani TaxID=323732 RepID=A0AAD9PKG0_9APIC|nr:hypothetical protein BdWA1_001627 [Babesia duncani]